MKAQNTIIVSLISIIITLLLVAANSKSPIQGSVPVVRAEKIELVDESGKVRASLRIEKTGESVFRLMDSDGTIRVKIGASKDGSGFVLLNDLTDPAIRAVANASGTSLTLTGKDGHKKQIVPNRHLEPYPAISL